MSRSARTATINPVSIQPRPGLLLQRKCDCGQHTGGGECEECKKKKSSLQRHTAGGSGPAVAPPIVHDVLRSPGESLSASTRAFMERGFGEHLATSSLARTNTSHASELTVDSASSPHEREAKKTSDAILARNVFPAAGLRQDFSGIRIHADAQAHQAARAVNAQAFTVGSDIVFGAGRYSPGDVEGRRLLAHELTHTLQQDSDRQVHRKLSVDPNLPSDAPATDPSAALTPTQRFAMMNTIIQSLCPDFKVTSSGAVETAKAQSIDRDVLASGSHGTGCCCLSILTETPKQWTIEVSSVIGAQTRTDQVFLNPTNTPIDSGAFTSSNKLAFQGAVPTAGHELCGHAALEEVQAHPRAPNTTSRVTQDIHDPTVRLENEISKELGVPAANLRGLARSGSHRGESVDRITIQHFPFNVMEIPASEQSKIKLAAKYIFNPAPAVDQNEFVGIRGHSDNKGTPDAKKAVSEGRARNVEKALKAEGVPSDIQTDEMKTNAMKKTTRFDPVEGVSDSQPPPAPADADPENWRRVEIFMSSMPAGAQVPPADTPTGVTAHTQNPNVPALKGSADACIRKIVGGAYP